MTPSPAAQTPSTWSRRVCESVALYSSNPDAGPWRVRNYGLEEMIQGAASGITINDGKNGDVEFRRVGARREAVAPPFQPAGE